MTIATKRGMTVALTVLAFTISGCAYFDKNETVVHPTQSMQQMREQVMQEMDTCVKQMRERHREKMGSSKTGMMGTDMKGMEQMQDMDKMHTRMMEQMDQCMGMMESQTSADSEVK